MNLDALSLRRLTAGVVFPPFPFQPVDLNRLYATVTERYPYQSLQHLPDGIRMANPDSDCFIQTSRIQINESVMYYRTAKEKVMDLFEMIQDRAHIPQFMTFGIKLVAFLPFNAAPEAAQFIEQKMLSQIKQNADVLGGGRQGTGIRMVLHQDGIYELKIEPFLGDLSQMYVELDIQYPEPFADIKTAEPRMDAAYNYLFGPVRDFIASFA